MPQHRRTALTRRINFIIIYKTVIIITDSISTRPTVITVLRLSPRPTAIGPIRANLTSTAPLDSIWYRKRLPHPCPTRARRRLDKNCPITLMDRIRTCRKW